MKKVIKLLEHYLKKVIKLLEHYLKWAGFTCKEKNIKIIISAVIDTIVLTIYSVISIIIICTQGADLKVLTLNVLCFYHSTINNIISALKITNEIKRINKKLGEENKCKKTTHYHTKAIVLASISFIITVIKVSLIFEEIKPVGTIKLIISILIIIVLLNDYENNLVYAYNANIELMENNANKELINN